MSYLCIDIGGTSIKYGLLEEEENKISIFEQDSIDTRVTLDKNYILEDIIELVEKFISKKELKGVCVSSAGIIDSNKGEVVFAGPTIPKYTGTKIKETIEKKFSVRCEVENDVNCAGLGEYWYGVGKGSSSMVCLTIGTGIGGSIILNGKLLNGYGFTAGEVGYTIVDNEHIQNIASTTSLIKRVYNRKNEIGEKTVITGENIDELNGYIIFEAAKKGDITCIEGIDYLVDKLSIVLQNIIYLLNPEIIVIGGGIAKQKEYLEEKIKNSVYSKLAGDIFKKTKISLAESANNAGMIGAFYHFKNKNKCSSK